MDEALFRSAFARLRYVELVRYPPETVTPLGLSAEDAAWLTDGGLPDATTCELDFSVWGALQPLGDRFDAGSAGWARMEPAIRSRSTPARTGSGRSSC